MQKKIILILIVVCFSTPSLSYIDPFTGAFVIQAILAFFAAVIFYLGYPVRIIKKIYNKLLKKKNKK